jgi:hypothetical protein
MAIEMTGRKFTDDNVFMQMKDEEYLYWESKSPAEAFASGHQMSVEGYHAYGYPADGSGLKTVAFRVERP